MNKYIAVQHNRLEALEKEVNEFIDKGYMPIGGVKVSGAFYIQSLILKR